MQALAHGLRLPQALRAPQQVRSRGRSRGLECRAELTSDGACRIKGAVEDVYSWVASPDNFEQYRPGVQSCRLIKGDGPEVGSCYQLSQTVGLLKDVSVTYKILDLQPERRVVYAISSDLFMGTEQTVFIEDPNEPVVVVRTVSTVELKLLKRFLQPFIAGSLTNAQPDNMGRLADLLNSSSSPIKDSWEKVERRQSKNPFSSLFGGGRRRSSGTGSQTTKRRSESPAVRGADLLGYYQVLGLDSRKYKYTKPEDIKSAFRSAALVMHPDKFSMDADLMSDEERRKDMEDNYKKLARAYEVLRNPEQKRLYDEGRLGELQQQQRQ